MDQISGARVIASSPGRLRIEIPGLYHCVALKQRLEDRLAQHDGVTEVLASPLTGRVLVLFDPRIPPAELLPALGIGAGKGGRRDEVPPTALRMPLYPPWHLRDAAEALAGLGSSERGLTRHEAAQRLRQGKNLVALPRRRSAADILLGQLASTPVVLLGISAVVSLFTGGLAEAVAIGAVLVVNTSIGFATERQAEATISSLSELVDEEALALRDGKVAQVDASHLVPGDVVVLAPGARIAADMRLLRADGLRVDESMLTGESLPVDKSPHVLTRPVPLAERSNMVYRGTAVTSGGGLGLVVGTGRRTEAGAVEALTRSTDRPQTPIQLQLDQLGKQLVMVSIAMCLGVFAVGLLRGQQRACLFRSALALAIAAVPEGLPTVATTSLARGLRRMRERDVLFRHLHAVETIGAISVICMDKTGTLTMNEMSAVEVRTARQVYGRDQVAAGELRQLLEICVLSNEMHLSADLPDSPLRSSSTERALLELARQAGVDPAPLRHRHPVVSSELRVEGRNYMRTVHGTLDANQRLVAVKGSPAQVLALCTCYLEAGQPVPFDEASRATVLRQNDDMADNGLRVLGFACASAAAEQGDDVPLTWLGLVGLADPLRPGVDKVIERFHDAGIRTVMLTGDQAGTAYQIGKLLRLDTGGELDVVNSDELENASSETLRKLAARAHIFSRVTPSDKLRIVKAIQQSGATVAMTGDGINDSPALRAADVGIAMGSGADVALSAADVALKYDRLDDLLAAIVQGRTIADNIRKAVHFLVSSNLSEILVVLGTVAAGTGSPLSPLQLLWLNLLTDIFPAIALAEEPPESDVMRRAPRRQGEALVHKEEMLGYAREAGWLAAGALGAWACTRMRHGSSARASTVAFDTIVLGQVLHAKFCRSDTRPAFAAGSPRNRQLDNAAALSALLQGLAHFVPGLRRLLGLAGLGPLDMLAVLAGGGLPLLANEWAKRRKGRAGGAFLAQGGLRSPPKH